MDVFSRNLKGRDPEKDCSHRPKKCIVAGGLDLPRKPHLPGFTGKTKGKIIKGKYKSFEQIIEKGKLKWVESKT